MHSSKGLEFPLVCIPAIGSPSKNDGDEKEEARLLYVAMTRATHELVMTHADNTPAVEKMYKAMKVLHAM
jgi:ATP-dependent exoDNAse (exonuclease V) beta subunit